MQTKEALTEILEVARKIIADEVEKLKLAQEEEKETHVVIVLDSSGSMLSIKQETIGAFNGFVDTLKENAAKGGKTTVSLVVFGEAGQKVKVKLDKQAVYTAEKLTGATYVPGAYTPMYDGIGTGIALVEGLDVANKNVAFLIQTFTDGMENASTEWTAGRLKEKIQSLEKKGNWTFTFAGANVDVNAMVDKIGMQRVNSVAYNANAAGMRGMSAANNIGTQSYFAARGAGNLSMAGGFYNDSVAQKLLTSEDIKQAAREAQASQERAKLQGEAEKKIRAAHERRVGEGLDKITSTEELKDALDKQVRGNV